MRPTGSPRYWRTSGRHSRGTAQRVELAHGELNLPAADQHGAGGRVDLEAIEDDRLLALGLGVPAPEHRVDSGGQLGGEKGLTTYSLFGPILVGATPPQFLSARKCLLSS